MAYIGKSIESGTFSVLDTSGNTYNGSNTAFNLGTQVGSVAQLLVSHDGVIQKPGTDYTLSSGGAAITFTTAPASGASIFIVEISGAVGGPLDSDLNGTELILDADGDTSLHASTDDQIDVKIAGADDFKFSANAMNVLSGSTLTIDSGATITNSGTANGFGTDPDGAQVFNESSADVDFRVESNGNANMFHVDGGNDGVGIGQTGNAHTLSVHDTTAFVPGSNNVANTAPLNVRSAASSGNIGAISLGGNDNCAIYNHESQVLALQAHTRMLFMCSADNDDKIGTKTERMRITDDGILLVGRQTNNGSYPGLFSVSRGSTNAITATIENTGTSGISTSILKVLAAQNSSNSFNMIDGHNTANGGRFLVRDTSNVQNTNNSYGATSDERIKQDIEDASSQWDDIKALKIRKYKLKSDTSKTQIGVVAQELETAGMNGLVEEALPEKEDVVFHSDFGTVVDGTADNGATPIKDKDGNITGYQDVFTAGKKIKSVKYSILYMKAIKALQEAITKIETLETEMNALKARVTTLEG